MDKEGILAILLILLPPLGITTYLGMILRPNNMVEALLYFFGLIVAFVLTLKVWAFILRLIIELSD